MGPETTVAATFKYDHGGERTVGWLRGAAMATFAALGVLGGLVACTEWSLRSPAGPALFIGVLMTLLAYSSAPRVLTVGPRYVICDDLILYYASVSRLVLDASAGELRLESGPVVLTLSREKFPTGAQKPEKIAVNRALKFQRVAATIVERVRAAAPGAAIEGVRS